MQRLKLLRVFPPGSDLLETYYKTQLAVMPKVKVAPQELAPRKLAETFQTATQAGERLQSPKDNCILRDSSHSAHLYSFERERCDV